VTRAEGALARLGVRVATCGPLGYVPIAPGTLGSAAGVAVFALLRQFGSPGLEVAVILLGFLVGVWAASVAERHFGRVDPGAVVVDEVVGMLLTVALLPLTPLGVFTGFVIFRALDVVKPWPASRFERLPGGLGIMADDGMAGVYGHVVLRGIIGLSPVGWITVG
jgi:phosphatidylglycerophosphatase A